ncbi:DNA-binding transcriptional ArsR family regulator [Chitinophaga dinghuensis]|uniref:DNA-binding transcriptional ArsR family regulator n=1 Tax=Chitinophaga dinghuensis TaxID=1539050 RepID=A0A327VSC2_9BACT|nr:winged helix-turn-helix domain-containing protein [Chitinophaga dinghuensis]RAJ77277.1 DNA-binding transcriptional ArsR family regulator [Chitinophaga dinghuensis]
MENQFSDLTSLIGDPIRSMVLWTLLDGRAYTAMELATCTGTSAQNMSMHLSKLLKADLLVVESQGRHRYYRFSRQEVAYAIEALANLIPHKKEAKILANISTDIKYCRTCYDHLAGKVGVLITERLTADNIIALQDKSYILTRKGDRFFQDLGIDFNVLKTKRRALAIPCLDWSERRYHLAGALGAALLDKMLEADWIRRKKDSRAIIITSTGSGALYKQFKVEV